MIVAYTGKLGSGKTYTMTKDIVKELNKGTKVYSNYKINWYGYEEKRRWYKTLLIWLRIRKPYRYYPASNLSYWSETYEILNLHEGIVAIDEGSVYLNSRNWDSLDPEFQRKILQSRKDGLHIYFTAQRIGQIDITLRNLVNTFYVATFKNFFGFKAFVLGIYEIDNNGDINEEDRLGIRIIRLNTKVRYYDTNEKVASMFSTAFNLTKQISQRNMRIAKIRKHEDELNEMFKLQNINITVAELLKLEEDTLQAVHQVAETAEAKPTLKPAKKAVNNALLQKKPRVKKLTVITA